ncbi:ImmA/IrrE family metallo-endopeptidase [Melissococcus plutonius]|uniref:ImmA/IrrE family metallo-endopeptidase n=1 Tax=Melissococcus plutonius TaxID=33970 RepID=UPI0021E5D5D4|nr:ImmA/IrrE family metallo-endopeptidase [Melissococcus plutonius]MCV2505839.1 ImmA/IrrE family metallo-endopeptidase [Melissococcus plutonius]MCV2508266.1 ImmA/IrrE family metallo-endopeptidase [Melissococcus plutonius]MCV2520672.1 ImmA/IrrE family metallo-endopeptidase [Melissococcus plutonius]
MVKISELLSHFKVRLMFLDLDNNGYYEPTTKTILINCKLDETDCEKIILHELGHFILHQHLVPLYKMSVPHLKMEYEANCFMIKQLIDAYFDFGGTLEAINYVQFMNYYGISYEYEDVIKSILINYNEFLYV